jgi:hypothetical protein
MSVAPDVNSFLFVINAINWVSCDPQKKGQREARVDELPRLPIADSDIYERYGPPADLVAVCDANLETLSLCVSIH